MLFPKSLPKKNSEGKNNKLALLEKKKEEEKITAESNESRISISSFAAPIYYDNMGSGNAHRCAVCQKFLQQ